MKQLINLAFFAVLIIIHTSYSQDKREQERANEFFHRHARTAHPMPEPQPVEIRYLIPLAPKGSGFSNFINVVTTVNETEQYKMQNESSIAVNPTNKNNLIASAVDYRDTSATKVYVSGDGGMTWVNYNLGRPYVGWTASNDPSVAFDLDGNGYLVVGGFGERSNGNTQGQVAENGIFLARSTDEGVTWEPHIPVIVHRGQQTIDSTFEDKYYIWSDNSQTSPYKGHLYIPWKRVWAKDSATQIVISKSTDKGSTWSSPLAVSPRLPGTSEDTTYGQSFPLAVTGPNGEIYLVWNNGIEHAVGFARSTDGGNTFSTPRLIQYYNIFGITREIDPGIWRHTVKTKVRAEAYPSLVVDITDGPRSGWLYLTWAADNIPNIYFARSTDMGETWSSPVIVHSDTTNDQLWQWIALDRTNGDIAVMYLDSRDDPDNILTSTFVSYSSDGGTTWIDRRAADIAGDLRNNPFANNSFAGDYSGCAFHDGIIYPSWIDMRAAETDIYDSDVYTAVVDINKPAAPGSFDAVTIPERPEEIDLNWSYVTNKSFGQPLNSNDIKYLIHRDGAFLTELSGDIIDYTDTGLNMFELYKYTITTVYQGDSSQPRMDSAWAGGSREPGIPLFSDYSRDNSSISLDYVIPEKRLDDVTPFINPKYLNLYRDGEITNIITIDKEDAGLEKTVKDSVPENGYYYYFTTVSDTYDNLSPRSDTNVIYGGVELSVYSDDFNEMMMRKYLNNIRWGLSSTFARTGNSLTDSPDGLYSPLSDESLTIFPMESMDNHVTISFWHAAFVQLRDSAIIEYSDDMQTWKMITYFDSQMYEPWKDGIKMEDDWKFESFTVKTETGKLFFRFRLKANATKHDEGWYIDDLAFSSFTDVEDVTDNTSLILYPNPAGAFINLDMRSLDVQNIAMMNIYNQLGEQIVAMVNTSDLDDDYLSINTSLLSTGMYNIVVRLNNGKVMTEKFIKL